MAGAPVYVIQARSGKVVRRGALAGSPKSASREYERGENTLCGR
jgi:hypothetical protein